MNQEINGSCGVVHPWNTSKFTADEVTPLNFHHRPRRQEVQLPLPEANPIIRANILLEESMRHNWTNNAKVFQQHEMLKAQMEGRAVDPRQIQEELEFMWFQFRCEWQQLRTDVLSEMFRVPVPEALCPKTDEAEPPVPLSAEELEEKLREQSRQIETARKTYLEDLRQAFYPTTLMELFQKDLAPFEEDMNLCLLPSGRGHWAQLQATYLYQQQLARQAHETERLRRQQLAEKMTLANLTQAKTPEISIELCQIDLDEEDDDDDDDDGTMSSHSSHVDISNYHLQPTTTVGGGGHMPSRNSSDSCDDASSICGMSSAASAISSSRSLLAPEFDSPETSPVSTKNKRASTAIISSKNANVDSGSNSSSSSSNHPALDPTHKRSCSTSSSEDITYPVKPMAQYQSPSHLHEVMEALSQLTTTEGQQCPLEYHSVRYDEETRAQVFMSRRERKAYIIAALPQGRLFMTV